MDNTGLYRCGTLDKVTKCATVSMNIHDQSLCHCCHPDETYNLEAINFQILTSFFVLLNHNQNTYQNPVTHGDYLRENVILT